MNQQQSSHLYNCQLLESNLRLMEKKKFIKSQKICNALVDTEYFLVNSWIKKSNSEYNLQQADKSLQTLIKCKQNLNLQDRRLLYTMGEREFTLGNFDKSLEYLQDYQKLNPECKRTMIQIAQIEFRNGLVDQVEKKVEAFLQDQQLSYNLRLVLQSLMVQIQHKKQDYQKMNEFIGQIQEREPNDVFCQIYLADVKMNNAETREEAINTLKKLRLQIYKDRNQFSQQSFSDMIEIFSKYSQQLRE